MTKDVLWVQFDALSPLRQNWPREDEDKDDMDASAAGASAGAIVATTMKTLVKTKWAVP